MNLRSPHSWQDRAACRPEDMDLFFGPDGERTPERNARERRAKAICARCPVRPQCLEWAMGSGQRHGVWGGLSEQERAGVRQYEREQAEAAAAEAAEHRAVLLRELDLFEAAHGRKRLTRSRWHEGPYAVPGPEPAQPPVFAPVTAEQATRNRGLLEAELIAVEQRGRPGRAA
jgi:WhiB family redox-sensing transcriptional regulator